ncbi:autotransporter outer membrane beta-barrel domain-containing protein [Helicobacter sp. 11S02629-2]|uniref:autotransporter outer membrane beta-barrel domain-containing protein n=1 Tax=Helicobacter sp. 11S02629-2 TaxID=1476195 RepID=UPI000BA60005|nr:autotransporter outer membrane beta-barrel domain-containing protein [Helicobacter sp. 11S02629-2]PAF44583.1 hypothetical protein BKH40_04930 [Helicobacter sp. 11S02629-2]
MSDANTTHIQNSLKTKRLTPSFTPKAQPNLYKLAKRSLLAPVLFSSLLLGAAASAEDTPVADEETSSSPKTQAIKFKNSDTVTIKDASGSSDKVQVEVKSGTSSTTNNLDLVKDRDNNKIVITLESDTATPSSDAYATFSNASSSTLGDVNIKGGKVDVQNIMLGTESRQGKSGIAGSLNLDKTDLKATSIDGAGLSIILKDGAKINASKIRNVTNLTTQGGSTSSLNTIKATESISGGDSGINGFTNANFSPYTSIDVGESSNDVAFRAINATFNFDTTEDSFNIGTIKSNSPLGSNINLQPLQLDSGDIDLTNLKIEALNKTTAEKHMQGFIDKLSDKSKEALLLKKDMLQTNGRILLGEGRTPVVEKVTRDSLDVEDGGLKGKEYFQSTEYDTKDVKGESAGKYKLGKKKLDSSFTLVSFYFGKSATPSEEEKKTIEANKLILEENKKIAEENAKLAEENKTIDKENAPIIEENAKIAEENKKIRERNRTKQEGEEKEALKPITKFPKPRKRLKSLKDTEQIYDKKLSLLAKYNETGLVDMVSDEPATEGDASSDTSSDTSPSDTNKTNEKLKAILNNPSDNLKDIALQVGKSHGKFKTNSTSAKVFDRLLIIEGSTQAEISQHAKALLNDLLPNDLNNTIQNYALESNQNTTFTLDNIISTSSLANLLKGFDISKLRYADASQKTIPAALAQKEVASDVEYEYVSYSNVEAYAQALYTNIYQAARSGVKSYSSNGFGLIAGVNYRPEGVLENIGFVDTLIVGASLSYLYSRTDFEANYNTMAPRIYVYSLGEGFTYQASLGYALHAIGQTRSQSNWNSKASSSYLANEANASLLLGYKLNFDKHSILPALRLNYSLLLQSAYSEQGEFGLKVSSKTQNALLPALGLGYEFSANESLKLGAAVYVSYDVLSSNLINNVSFLDEELSFNVVTLANTPLSASINLNARYNIGESSNLGLTYIGTFKQDLIATTLSFRYGYRF